MRHGKKINHLGRTAAHRQALMRNLSIALILNKKIITTVAKAKALRTYIEPLLTKAKVDSTANRRLLFSYLGYKDAVSELYRVIAEKIANRPGGYSRVIKLGHRKGDGAEMALIELVDFSLIQNIQEQPAAAPVKKTRRKKIKSATTAAEEVKES